MNHLEDIAARETKLYQQSRAKIHLEAAIGSLLRAYSTAEVVRILQSQAEHLREFE